MYVRIVRYGCIRWRGRFAPHQRIAAAAASYELPLSRNYLEATLQRITDRGNSIVCTYIANYNETYYAPVQHTLTVLYEDGLLSRESYFDEKLEWEFYEFWHHEGRRARMGAAMMAPDYAWWHGFYELKHRYVTFMEEAERLRRTVAAGRYGVFPGRSGD